MRSRNRAPRGVAILLGLLLQIDAMAEWISRDVAIMGTRITVEVWHPDWQRGTSAVDAVIAEFQRIDELMSPYREESELSLLNREAASRPVVVSHELFSLLQRSREISELTQGAFDITHASVGQHYDYREKVIPDPEFLQENLVKINFRYVQMHPPDHRIKFQQPGVCIDLGGIAKGYAVDRGIALLEQRGIEHALITAGGDSRLLGDRRGRPWHIGIRDPRDRQGMVAVLPLINTAISTSGDYERYFESNGVRYHHIISPQTGRSANEVRSVTVIGPDASYTDALSTSVFVMGPAAGLALINRLPDLEAVIIDQRGKLLYSSGLIDLQPSDSAISAMQ